MSGTPRTAAAAHRVLTDGRGEGLTQPQDLGSAHDAPQRQQPLGYGHLAGKSQVYKVMRGDRMHSSEYRGLQSEVTRAVIA